MKQVLRQVKPKTVYTFGPDGITFHRDHIRSGEMTLDAVREINKEIGTPSNQMELFQVRLSDESRKRFQEAMAPSESAYWTFGLVEKTFQIQDRSQILAAIKAHKSQFNPKELKGFETYYQANPFIDVFKPRVNSVVT